MLPAPNPFPQAFCIIAAKIAQHTMFCASPPKPAPRTRKNSPATPARTELSFVPCGTRQPIIGQSGNRHIYQQGSLCHHNLGFLRGKGITDAQGMVCGEQRVRQRVLQAAKRDPLRLRAVTKN